MTRIRLNQEYRNKCASRIKTHLFSEDTQERQKYLELKEKQFKMNDTTFDFAKSIIRRHYTEEDVEKAYYLQNKFENVSTIAKDSCFHFHYMGKVESRDYNDNPIMEDKAIERHFDFKLNGSIDEANNYSGNNDWSYGFALYRDEINAQENCNADILIEQEGKDNNPHLTKYLDNNVKYLGGHNSDRGYTKEWNDKYSVDLIGRDYCRDRSIKCSEEEFKYLILWKQQKSAFVMAHYKWVKSVLDQMKEIKVGLKGYKYLDEAIELANELGVKITDHEIIRTNSTGLVIYNPKNLAERIKGMKNKNQSREDKIKARILYEKQQAESIN
jgi:hypothetical protein